MIIYWFLSPSHLLLKFECVYKRAQMPRKVKALKIYYLIFCVLQIGESQNKSPFFLLK